MVDIEEDKQVPLMLGRLFLSTRAALIDVKKEQLTLRVGDEEVHFNLNQSLKQPGFEKAECKIVETVVPISSKLIYDCKNQNSMNENLMNFQYIEDLDVEYLNVSLELKEIVLSLNGNCVEKLSSSE